MDRTWLVVWMAPAAWALIAPGSARAHALGAQCVRKGDTVRVEAYFEDDTPAQQALVRVLDSEEQEVVKGHTDAKGLWSFATPASGRYQVIIDAGAGHRVIHKMTIPGSRSAGAGENTSSISDAPTREQFTSFPWLKVMLGVGTIGVLAAAFMLSRRKSSPDGIEK
jgi:hypothetical protein